MNLLAVASRNKGKLLPVQQLAFALRVAPADMQARLDELILAGLIDIMPDRSLEPHNWSKRQWKSDDSADRVRKFRLKKKQETPGNGVETDEKQSRSGHVTVTATSPETDSEADTEKSNQPTVQQVAAREPVGSSEFIECKSAFNGSTEAMVVAVEKAMNHPNCRPNAETWLANLLRMHGQEAVAESYQELLTAKGTNRLIPRPLQWWSAVAKEKAAKAKAAPKSDAAAAEIRRINAIVGQAVHA
jgi:hypothetical protein